MNPLTRRAPPRPWTDEEIAFLRKEGPYLRNQAIAVILGRSFGAVKNKSYSLRIHKKRARSDSQNLKGVAWSEAEKEYFEKHIDSLSLEEIAANLGKSLESIRYRRWRLKTDKKTNKVWHGEVWDKHEIEFLRAHRDQLPLNQIARKLGRTYLAITNKASRMGLTRPPSHSGNHKTEGVNL